MLLSLGDRSNDMSRVRCRDGTDSRRTKRPGVRAAPRRRSSGRGGRRRRRRARRRRARPRRRLTVQHAPDPHGRPRDGLRGRSRRRPRPARAAAGRRRRWERSTVVVAPLERVVVVRASDPAVPGDDPRLGMGALPGSPRTRDDGHLLEDDARSLQRTRLQRVQESRQAHDPSRASDRDQRTPTTSRRSRSCAQMSQFGGKATAPGAQSAFDPRSAQAGVRG